VGDDGGLGVMAGGVPDTPENVRSVSETSHFLRAGEGGTSWLVGRFFSFRIERFDVQMHGLRTVRRPDARVTKLLGEGVTPSLLEPVDAPWVAQTQREEKTQREENRMKASASPSHVLSTSTWIRSKRCSDRQVAGI
jgi:hypothetical protein